MDLRPIVVKKYLESLKEEKELNLIFPLLLNSIGYEILTVPKENKGISEYGKDIVAVGDDDGIKTRYYFELKGGGDRHLTNGVLTKEDGVNMSIQEAMNAEFKTTYEGFKELPLKIILVHNGELRGSARATFTGFIERVFENSDIQFERWGIEELTKKFTEHLFGPELLFDRASIKLFNKVLLNLDVFDGISNQFKRLIDNILKDDWIGYKNKLQRKWQLKFETLKLISLIVYSESKELNNLDISKRYLTHLVLRFWHWILVNKLENDRIIINYFNDVLGFFFSVLQEYFDRTLPIAIIKDGLSSEISGRYEEIGYTKRTFEYLEYLAFFLEVDMVNPDCDQDSIKNILLAVLNANSVSKRVLIDVHSNTIINVINILLRLEENDMVVEYLQEVINYVIYRKESYGILPDAYNSYENVIRYTVTGIKPTFYSDSTSPLLAVLIELTALFDLKEDYERTRKFILEQGIDLGLFIPHHGGESHTNIDLEEQLFSNPEFNDGYQSIINLMVNLYEDMSFEIFKKRLENRKNEFLYDYRTDDVGYPYLKQLAHMYFGIPFFPDRWRSFPKTTKSPEKSEAL